MIGYNKEYLNIIDFLSIEEIRELDSLTSNIDFNTILNNAGHKSALEKLCFDFIYTSAVIEGNTYTRGEAESLFETKKPLGHKTIDEAIMLLNIKEALEYVLYEKPNITKHTLRELHQILSQNLLNKHSQGGVRKIPVFIGNSDYVPLNNPYELETQMDRMLNIYHSIKNPYNQAIYIHNNIAYLQYFEDCNKRLARLVQNLSLLNNNLAFVSYNALNAESKIMGAYKDSLLAYYEKGDVMLYKNFFVSEYKNTLTFLNDIQRCYTIN